MSIEEGYLLRCDNCGATRYYDGKYFLPQEVLAHAIVRHAWTVHGERAQCADCPPLCKFCGVDSRPSWCGFCRVPVVLDGQS